MSISPASSNSSSSQSSRLNWQPSQDANFHTASFGLCLGIMSHLPFCKQCLHTAVLKYRAIFADKIGYVLAMSTQANRTFHVTFHGDKDIFPGNALLLKLNSGKAHHDFRTAHQR